MLIDLIEIERFTFVGVDVRGAKVLDIRHLDDGWVELLLRNRRERILEARDLAVPHQGHDLCGNQIYGAFVLNRRVDLHAIDATPARRCGGAGASPLDGASAPAPSPRNDLVKNIGCTRRTG